MFGRIGAWIVQKVGAPAFKWLGMELAQALFTWLKNAWNEYKEERERKKRADQAQQGNSNYENKPSDSTYGDSP